MIRSVRLKQFRRYEDATFAFGPGANFVEGENNAGKTTVLYAIEYALFGRVDGFKSLMGLLHPGARGMGVELVLDGRDGAAYRLQRVHVLPPKSRKNLTGHFTLKRRAPGEDAETYVLSSDFEDLEDALALKLQEITGLTRRLFQIAVHMRQGEIARILEGSPELDIVLGVTAAVVASDELRGLALEHEKEAAALPVLEERAKGLQDERTRLLAAAAQAERDRAGIADELARHEETARRAKEADAARRPLEDACKSLMMAVAAHSEAVRRSEDVAGRRAEAASAGSREDVAARIADAEGRLRSLEDERTSADDALKTADDERRTLDRARGDLAGRIGRREKLPTGGDARCEACGAPIDAEHNAREVAGWKGELDAIDARIAALTATGDEARRRRKALDADDKRLTTAIAEDRRHLADLDKLDREAAQRREAVDVAAGKLLAAAEATRSAVAGWAGDPLDLPPTSADVGGAALLWHRLSDVLRDLGRTLGERRARAEADRDAAKARLDRADADLRAVAGRKGDVDRELAGVEAQLADLRKKAAKAERLRKMSAGFKDLQAALRERASAALAADAQALHAKLSAGDDRPVEFERVTVDPQKYSVQVVPKHLGEEVPAALYEGGGHRLLLGLAFKLAIARLAGKVPFVLLDEPTYGLDDRHRATLLDRIADLGVADQILLITHETMGKVGGRRVRVTRDGATSRAAEVS